MGYGSGTLDEQYIGPMSAPSPKNFLGKPQDDCFKPFFLPGMGWVVGERMLNAGAWRAAGTRGCLASCEGLRPSSALSFSLILQVDEIYHDESLGVHINIVLVRMIMVGYRQVRAAPGTGTQESLLFLRLLFGFEPEGFL